MRCSSNLDGATDNFRNTDNEIISRINDTCQYFFEKEIELNHVLAQIYENNVIDNNEKKAKIKAHSDKTKDMPIHGLIAFCTFYESYYNNASNASNKMKDTEKSKTDIFDYQHGNATILTKMRFKLKSTVVSDSLTKEFFVTLYPNYVLVIPLSTNRLYTHEITPSILPIEKIPIRMGYVIRCSKTKAVYKNNQTYIVENDQYTKLELANEPNIKRLKEIYYKENTTSDLINYGDINFSLNSGDYISPKI